MITHPEKLLFPNDGITKGDLASYYEAVAPYMVPLIKGRPITMERYPSGIGAKGFMQKNVSRGFPASLQRVEVPKKGGVVNYPLVQESRDLLWLVNQNCITPHVWTSRVPALERPDICVFDLDPSQENSEALRAVTLAVRDVLAEIGLASWVKTSGSKGFHIVVPLDGAAGFEEVVAFAHAVADVLIQHDPDHLTLQFLKADRGGRIYMDIGRNTPGATIAAPYAVRPRPGAPVSAPCTWEEVERHDVHPQSFTLPTMVERVATVGDLWAGMAGQSLTGPTRQIQQLGGELLVPVIRRFGPRG
ncbi:MAG: non-homologous end-joining DNA ligase [Vicinamibacteria bacterium]